MISNNLSEAIEEALEELKELTSMAALDNCRAHDDWGIYDKLKKAYEAEKDV